MSEGDGEMDGRDSERGRGSKRGGGYGGMGDDSEGQVGKGSTRGSRWRDEERRTERLR